MGSTQAQDFAESVAVGNMKLEVALEYHLTGNHYPPVSTAFIPACIKAIELGNNAEWDENWNEKITLPNGKVLTASEIIEGLHLQFFLEQGE